MVRGLEALATLVGVNIGSMQPEGADLIQSSTGELQIRSKANGEAREEADQGRGSAKGPTKKVDARVRLGKDRISKST